MLNGVTTAQPLSAILPLGVESSQHEVKQHVNRVNYFLRFLDSNHKSKMNELKMLSGMISYEAIIKGLTEEKAYFESSNHAIAPHMKELLTNFLDIFTGYITFKKEVDNSAASQTPDQDAFVQIALFMLPFVVENAKALAFLQANVLTAILDQNTHGDDLIFIKEKMNNVVNYFSGLSQGIVNLEHYERENLINKDNIEDFFSDLYFIIDDMDAMTRPLEIITKRLYSDLPPFKAGFMTLSASISDLKGALNKMVEEKAQEEEISETTLEKVTAAYKNFFNALKAPAEIS